MIIHFYILCIQKICKLHHASTMDRGAELQQLSFRTKVGRWRKTKGYPNKSSTLGATEKARQRNKKRTPKKRAKLLLGLSSYTCDNLSNGMEQFHWNCQGEGKLLYYIVSCSNFFRMHHCWLLTNQKLTLKCPKTKSIISCQNDTLLSLGSSAEGQKYLYKMWVTTTYK